ncbi:MAG: cold shock domain-containing protein [Acidimicrobiales bacterium]
MAPLTRGVITAFDAEAGLGSVRADGGQLYPFHCTQIADGSRQIDEAAKVEFEVVAGHGGQWEAAALRPCGG